MTYRSTTTTYLDTDTINAWRRGNDSGNGFGVGDENDSPAEAALRAGWTVLLDAADGVVAKDAEGRTVIVCDCYGPWGVYAVDAMQVSL
jgi:hypothetical protein